MAQTRLKSLICQLWNLKSFTIDYCASASEPSETDLTCLRDEISIKIAQILCHTHRKLPNDFFRLVQGGKTLGKLTDLDTDKTLFVELKGSLKGGKGGFGSLLRSIKPKAKDDENFEACRDLSGRRLRHVYNEQRLREFHQRQDEEEKYVQEELKEYERSKKQLQGAIQ